jgi:1-acyl-sn-glycerol-3-phosphate acyltransferase
MDVFQLTTSVIVVSIGILIQYVAKFSLQLMGWKTDARTISYLAGNPRCIAISLHTSNWDGIVSILFQLAYGFPVMYVIKQSWIDTPVAGTLLTRLGFIGVDEDRRGHTKSIVDNLAKSKRFVFCIMPEGQRAYINSWKSGYYHIAKSLDVSILPLIVDYAEHRIIMADLVPVGNRTLDEVSRECQQRLVVASVPLYPEHAYPAPRCYTHYRSCINEQDKTSPVDWRSMSLLYLLPGILAYGFLLPVVGLWLVYCRFGTPGVHK